MLRPTVYLPSHLARQLPPPTVARPAAPAPAREPSPAAFSRHEREPVLPAASE